ncbi:MAG: hypothetical protein WKF48_05595 [Solirubrobacteraceae bacterium]
MWRSAIGLGSIAAALLFAPGAGAEVRFNAVTTPPEIGFGSPVEVTFRIEIRTGATPAEFEIAEDPPSWGTRRDVRPGAPARHTGSELEGPGELTIAAVVAAIAAPPLRAGLLLSCGERIDSGLTINGGMLRIPARSTSTLISRWSLSESPPFGFTDYRPVLKAKGSGISQRIDLPKPRIVGPVGVPLRLLRDGPRRAGRTQRIRGRTDPQLAGRTVVLRLFGPVGWRDRTVVPDTQDFRTLARVKVNRLGYYDYRWKPRHGGQYGAYPSFLGKEGSRLRDHGCPIPLKVR